MNNFINHLHTVLLHKKWVFYYCWKAGIPVRGLFHDMSKFSPVEFLEGVKYYQGNRSPIDKAKEVQGYSLAWLHHKGRNKHHYEYWTDNFQRGFYSPVQMPYKYAVELICDYLGAAKAYGIDNNRFYAKEYSWWKQNKKIRMMAPQTKIFVDVVFHKAAKCESSSPNFSISKSFIEKCWALSWRIYKESERSEF